MLKRVQSIDSRVLKTQSSMCSKFQDNYFVTPNNYSPFHT